MNHSYRERSVQYVARLSEEEIKRAIREFVIQRDSGGVFDESADVVLKVTKDGYDNSYVAAEVHGARRDES